jgi:hypothetical protein
MNKITIRLNYYLLKISSKSTKNRREANINGSVGITLLRN